MISSIKITKSKQCDSQLGHEPKQGSLSVIADIWLRVQLSKYATEYAHLNHKSL